jgi:hypothetical protein
MQRKPCPASPCAGMGRVTSARMRGESAARGCVHLGLFLLGNLRHLLGGNALARKVDHAVHAHESGRPAHDLPAQQHSGVSQQDAQRPRQPADLPQGPRLVQSAPRIAQPAAGHPPARFPDAPPSPPPGPPLHLSGRTPPADAGSPYARCGGAQSMLHRLRHVQPGAATPWRTRRGLPRAP